MKTFVVHLLGLGAAGLISMWAGSAAAENWPAWRGPRGDGTSRESSAPTQWSATQNITWKTEIPGAGHSSPIVWGDRVFTATALPEQQERALVCLERRTGKILWQQTVFTAPLEPKAGENSYASGTPATDGERVYVAFLEVKRVVVAAYDFKAKPLWLVRPGEFQNDQGVMHIVKAGGTYERVAANELGETCYSSPAVSEGQLFLRGFRHLYCIGRPRRDAKD